jgi:Na+-driven multidrug efflux pump
VMQAIFLPAMALAFAAAPIAAQNHAARRPERVRTTFRAALLMGSALMFTLTLLCQWRPDWLVRPFAGDAAVVAVAAEYLTVTSWNFVASGVIFTCSGMFQAFGNTWPSLLSSSTRLLTFATPAIWMSTRPGLQLRHLWLLSVATVTLQMLISLLLLRRQTARAR